MCFEDMRAEQAPSKTHERFHVIEIQGTPSHLNILKNMTPTERRKGAIRERVAKGENLVFFAQPSLT